MHNDLDYSRLKRSLEFFVTEVIRTVEHSAAKLGPGLDHALIPSGTEAEWTSFRGGVKAQAGIEF